MPPRARKPPLKVVKAGARRAPAPPKTLKDAVGLSERALLVMMRTKIANEIDGGVPPHTLAPLMRQLRDIDKEIRLLDIKAEEESRENAGPAPDEAFDASAI